MDENEISRIVVDSAIRVHKDLGPGLLESVYEAVLADVLQESALLVERQVPIALTYAGRTYPEAFRADLIIENLVILELKSIDQLTPIHKKQLLTYLRLTGLKLGLLLNFNEVLMKSGIARVVNGLT